VEENYFENYYGAELITTVCLLLLEKATFLRSVSSCCALPSSVFA
jgi:hypothetical protein